MKVVTGTFAFIARFHVRPDAHDRFRAYFNTLWDGAADDIERYANFLFFGWSRTPNEFVAMESWNDLTAVAAIRDKQSFKDLGVNLLACCDRSMTIELFSGADTDGSIFATFPQGPSPHHPRLGDIGTIII